MDIADAFQIVLDLARQNIRDNKEPAEGEYEQQTKACNMVEDYVVNQLGDN